MDTLALRRRRSIVIAALAGSGLCLFLAWPIASWMVGQRARERADHVGEQLGLAIAWDDVSLAPTGLASMGVELAGLRVQGGATTLLEASRLRADVAWRGGAVVVDGVLIVGATVHARLRDDRPAQVLALLDRWKARAKAVTTDADADADAAGKAQRPWPAVRIEDARVVVSAQGGRSGALDGLAIAVERAEIALRRPEPEAPRPLGQINARLALAGPASGVGTLQLRSDARAVEVELVAEGDPWRWARDIGPLRTASVAKVALHLEPDAALAGRVARQDADAPARLQATLDALVGDLRLVDAGATAEGDVRVQVGEIHGSWPGAALRIARLAASSPSLDALRAIAPPGLAKPLASASSSLGPGDHGALHLDVEALDTGKIAVLLAGGGEPALRGLRLRLGQRSVAVRSFAVVRPGATLIGARKPAELHVAGVRVDAGDLTPPAAPSGAQAGQGIAASAPRWTVPPAVLALVARLQAATERKDDVEPAAGTAEAGPPPEALRPLWTSTPAKTEPSTRKYAAPLAALPGKLDAGVASLVALRDALAKQRVVVDVRDASLTARISGMEIGLQGVDFALQPRIGASVGRATLALGLVLRGRSAGSLSLSTALPAAAAPLELAVSAQGDDLARVVASLDRRLGLGAAPALHLDGWIVAGPGIGGELRATVGVRQIGIDWWRFAERKVDDVALDLDLSLRWPADAGWLRLDIGEAAFGAASAPARLRASGWLLLHRLKPSPRVDLSLLLPTQDCGVALDAIPEALLPTVGRIRASGPTSGWVDLRVDIAHPWYSEIDFALDDARCRIESTGKLDVDGLKGDFERPVNEDGKLLQDQTFGPLSDAWIPIGRMPRWLPYAMTTTEDGGFFQHHGLNAFLLNRAIRLDLHVGRFVYGGSTITQQLAKNLFFRRTKVLSRKLEEALATWLLERRLGKIRILEIYANAVEMAPHLYGVARGAAYYFGKDASALGPAEAAWLGILKPCPRCAGAHFRARSMPVWYQQRLLEILTRMWRNHIIDDATFELWQNRVPPFVDWPAEKLAQRSSWPIPEKKEPEPRRLDRGRLGDGARTEKARTPKADAPAGSDAAGRAGSTTRRR